MQAKVSGQVYSQARHRPVLEGKYEIPSGLFLSWIEVPFGSILDVISAEPRACLYITKYLIVIFHIFHNSRNYLGMYNREFNDMPWLLCSAEGWLDFLLKLWWYALLSKM